MLVFAVIAIAWPVMAQDGGDANKSMSKEEMVQGIKDEVSADDEVMKSIPELKKRKDSDGKEFYTGFYWVTLHKSF